MGTSTRKPQESAADTEALVQLQDDVRTTVLQTDRGRTHIHQDVVGKIAGLSSLARALSGNERKDLGVAVSPRVK